MEVRQLKSVKQKEIAKEIPDWFKQKSEKQQQQYLDEHPNSELTLYIKSQGGGKPKDDKGKRGGKVLPDVEIDLRDKQKKEDKIKQLKTTTEKPEAKKEKKNEHHLNSPTGFSGPQDNQGSAFNKPTQERQVVAILDKLHAIVQKAKELGKDAPNFDLCKISIPGSNLFCDLNKGIPRKRMPQLKGVPTPGSWADTELQKNDKGEVDGESEFMEYLKEKGVHIEDAVLPATSLKATQTELVGPKVVGMFNALKENPNNPGITAPIFVSRDGYVLDGHHRWAAMVAYDIADGVKEPIKMKTIVVDMDIEDLVKETNDYAEMIGVASKTGSVKEHGRLEAYIEVAKLI